MGLDSSSPSLSLLQEAALHAKGGGDRELKDQLGGREIWWSGFPGE